MRTQQLSSASAFLDGGAAGDLQPRRQRGSRANRAQTAPLHRCSCDPAHRRCGCGTRSASRGQYRESGRTRRVHESLPAWNCGNPRGAPRTIADLAMSKTHHARSIRHAGPPDHRNRPSDHRTGPPDHRTAPSHLRPLAPSDRESQARSALALARPSAISEDAVTARSCSVSSV